jgi:hypothetical protein
MSLPLDSFSISTYNAVLLISDGAATAIKWRGRDKLGSESSHHLWTWFDEGLTDLADDLGYPFYAFCNNLLYRNAHQGSEQSKLVTTRAVSTTISLMRGHSQPMRGND